MKRNGLIVAIVLVLAASLAFVWWRTRSAPAQSSTGPEEVVRVERGTLTISFSAGGNVALERKIGLVSRIRGRVAEIRALEGLRVESGQTLVCLETFDMERDVRQAQSQVEQARAQLAKAEAGARLEELDAAQAAIAIVEAQFGASEAMVVRARANVAAAEAALAGSQASLAKLLAGASALSVQIAEKQVELARNQLWGLQGQRDALGAVGSAAEYQAAQGNVAAAESQVAIAQLTLQELKAGARAEDVAIARAQVAQSAAALDIAKADLQQAESQVDAGAAQLQQARAELALLKAGSRPEDVEAARAQLYQAELALDQAEATRSEACIPAPFDGLVARIDVQANDLVESGQAVLVLVDDSSYHIALSVDEADISQITDGQTVELTLDALPEVTLTGRIGFISPLAESDSGVVSYQVRVDITERAQALREGLSVNANIVAQELEDRLIVPNGAIILDEDTGERYVIRQIPSGTEFVRIETGATNYVLSEVVTGLQEGDLVLARSTSYREAFRDMMTSSFPGGR
ncbi:MAG: efflux RND transporter periplasmic adaptor subunit [Chloroflexi bacterium]|nr:efflux RND transporter periplasmic adaptor subunit [Chloroflexota bacterium]